MAPAPHPGLVRAGGAGLFGIDDLGRAAWVVAPLDWPHFPVLDGDGVRRHWRLWPHDRLRGVLRCRAAYPADVQRHGCSSRLDEHGLVHQSGRGAVPARLFRPAWAARRFGLFAGLDGRFLPGGHADCATFAGHADLHRAGFFPGAFRWALAAHHCSLGCSAVLFHLCGGANLWCGFDCLAPDRGAV